MKHLSVLVAAVILSAATVPRAAAVPLNYEIGPGSSVSANSSDPGLVVYTSLVAGLVGTNFTLDDGQSSGWFDFFKIWTNETTVNPDDLSPKPISAVLAFSDPVANALLDGVTFGGTLIIAQWGRVEWDGPTTVTLGDRTFSVQLSDETFNFGLFGLHEGVKKGAIVKAKVTQIASTVSVPDVGSTLLLLGVTLLGLGHMRRRIRSC